MTSRIAPAWSPAVTSWIAWLTAGGLPSTTLYLRQYQLARVSAAFADRDPFTLAVSDLSDWLAGHTWQRETLRSFRAALRSFYGWAHATGQTDNDPARLLRKIPPAQARPRPAPEPVVSAALGRADDRAWLMLMLGSRHGLRRGEICRVHTRDLTTDHDGRAWLLVHGKGNKQRTIPVLAEIARVIRQAPPGWLFPGRTAAGHLSPAWVGKVLSEVMAHGATPHQLRHRFGSTAYGATHDIRAVQELLGHASVATTQIYTAVPRDDLRSVLESAA